MKTKFYIPILPILCGVCAVAFISAAGYMQSKDNDAFGSKRFVLSNALEAAYLLGYKDCERQFKTNRIVTPEAYLIRLMQSASMCNIATSNLMSQYSTQICK